MSDGNRDADASGCPHCGVLRSAHKPGCPEDNVVRQEPGLSHKWGLSEQQSKWLSRMALRSGHPSLTQEWSEEADDVRFLIIIDTLQAQLVEAKRLHQSDLDWIRVSTVDAARIEAERDTLRAEIAQLRKCERYTTKWVKEWVEEENVRLRFTIAELRKALKENK